MPDPNDHRSIAQAAGTPRRRYYRGPRLGHVLAIEDLRARTHKLLPRFVLEYLEAGAEEEATLAREREAYSDWWFLPRQLHDVSHRSVSYPILGREARLPLAVAPTGLNGLFMRGADSALARGAASFGVPFSQSTMSNERLEDVARIPGLRHWMQLYVFGGEEIWLDITRRAHFAGCEALLVTTNAQTFGRREWSNRNQINGRWPTVPAAFNAALHPRWMATTLNHGMPSFANVTKYLPRDKRSFFDAAEWIRGQMPASLSWKHIETIRQHWKRALFVKGLMHPDDVRAALDSGVDGVMLGQHGGRQADWSTAALDVLPLAREILGDAKALYISGGIRRGSDVLKAIALGADAVLAGRAPLYGLCAYGQRGVEKALEVIEEEMRNEMAQLGVASLDRLGPDILVRRSDLPFAPAPAAERRVSRAGVRLSS
jgi:(S)-mandelate dehydrogenase